MAAKSQTLRQALTRYVATQLRPHDKLPSERELMRSYQVSRMTVRSALASLVEEGMVYRVRGAGTFAGEDSAISPTLRLTSFTEDMRDRNLQPTTELLAAAEVAADPAVARDLRLVRGDPTVRLLRLRYADDVPMALETVHLPAVLVPGLLGNDVTGSLHELLRARYGLDLERAVQRIEAAVLNHTDAELLQVSPYAPALRVQRVGMDTSGNPIERSIALFRGDRYFLQVAVRRDHAR